MYRQAVAKKDKVIQVRHALDKMKKAINGTDRKLSVIGPVRGKQFVKALSDCFTKVEIAAENEIHLNLELRKELEQQGMRIADLEQEVKNLFFEMEEERQVRMRNSNSLQQQIDDINRELEDRAVTEDYLIRNVKDALEAALAVYNTYGGNNNVDEDMD